MALIWADRVLETTTSTGTGALNLAGAVTGYKTFTSVCASGDTAYVCVEAINASGVPTGDWEVFLGTYSNIANTLARTTRLASSTGAAVNFAAGTKRVMLVEPASIVSQVFSGQFASVTTTGNIGVGTPSPSRRLTIAGTANAYLDFVPTSYNRFTIGSDLNGFVVYDDTSTAYRFVIKANGNIGIGTTAPATWRTYINQSNADVLYLRNDTSTGVQLAMADTGWQGGINMTNGDLLFQTGGLTERARLNTNGNFGIGTTNPTARLHLRDTLAAAGVQARIINTDSTGFTGVTMGDDVDTRAQIWAGNATYASFGGGGSLNYSANGGPHVWAANYIERMRLTAAGALLVGGATPIYPTADRGIIEVNGATQALYGLGVGGTAAAYTLHDGTNMEVMQNRNGYMRFGTNNAVRMTLLAGGGVAFGVDTDPGAGSTMVGIGKSYFTYTQDYGIGTPASSGLQIFTANGDVMRFGHMATGAFTERMRVDANGNLGLGASTPVNYTNYRGLTVEASTGGFLHLRNTGATASLEMAATPNISYAKTVGAQPLWFGTTNLERMRITATGDVGIGTTSPQQKFVVSNAGAGGIEIIPTGVIQSYNRGTSAYQNLNYDASLHVFRIGVVESMRIEGAGVVTATGDFRAPVFYDSNNTGYFTNPNASSRMASIQLDQTPVTTAVTDLTTAPIQLAGTYQIGTTPTWMPMTHQRAVYDQGYVTHLNTGLYKHNVTWGSGISGWYAAIGGADAGPTEAWYLTYGGFINHTQGYVSTANSFRAPIFYDSQDTNYFLDPATSFSFRNLSGNVTFTSTSSGLYVGNAEASALTVRVGAAYGFAGTYSNGAYDLISESIIRFRIGATEKGSVDVGGNVYAVTSHRAPIFYDSNNTGFYLDPNGTSNLQALIVGSTITGSVSGSSTSFPTRYDSGVRSNPQDYFSSTVGLRVAMTGLPVTWADTLWINGYSGGDVPNMCALHTSRQGTPRMWISTQSNAATAYGTYYEFPTYGYNSTGSTGNLYAGIVYDANNTAYASDPAGNSTFDRLTVRKTGVTLGSGNSSQLEVNNAGTGACNISFHREGAYGAHFGLDTDNIFSTYGWSAGTAYTGLRVGDFYAMGSRPLAYSVSNGSLIIKGDSGGWGTGLYFQGSGGTTFGAFGALGGGNTLSYWYVGTDFTSSAMRFYSAGYGEGTVSLRAPIFYDNNNTGYYLDPASTSVLNIIQLANGAQIAENTTTSFTAYRFNGPSRGGYFGHNLGGVANAFMPVMYDAAGNGGSYYELAGKWSAYYLYGNDCWGFGTSTTNAAFNIYCPKGIYSGGRNDGTIFYDSNDTGYYMDPNSSSSFNVLYAYYFRRYSHHTGHLEGGYNNLGNSQNYTNPIFTIGSSYNPAAQTLASMYGIGYNNASIGFHPSGAAGWGLYVASGGVSRIWMDSDSGNIIATGNITAYASDKRLKTNITPISNALDKLMQIRGVEFDWVDNIEEIGFSPQTMHETGVIAQEVQAVIPDAVMLAPFNNNATDLAGFDSEYLTVDKEKIIPLLIEAIKEQQMMINMLEQKVNLMESK